MTSVNCTDAEKRLTALMLLEEIDITEDRELTMLRVSAAHYLVQAMGEGPKPDNYEDVIGAALNIPRDGVRVEIPV